MKEGEAKCIREFWFDVMTWAEENYKQRQLWEYGHSCLKKTFLLIIANHPIHRHYQQLHRYCRLDLVLQFLLYVTWLSG